MVQTTSNATLLEDRRGEYSETWSERFMEWFQTEFVWYAGSFTFHLLAISALLLLGERAARVVVVEDPTVIDVSAPAPKQPPPEPITFSMPEPEQPATPPEEKQFTLPEILPDKPPPYTYEEGPGRPSQIGGDFDDRKDFVMGGDGTPLVMPGLFGGGKGGFHVSTTGPGAQVDGPGQVPTDAKDLGPYGLRGPGYGPGHGRRKTIIGEFDGYPVTEYAVRIALEWLARHQLPDGNWSLKDFHSRCTDTSCTGPGNVDADAAATAMGVLPFLAHGETHRSGAHSRVVGNGLLWLMRHQKSDGDLSAGCPHQMYAHALATIALCEAYGMTSDTHLRDAARSAVQFIQAAQNRQTGGWRYHPGEEGDTSVVGWQVMALRSAQTAGLSVDASTMQGAGKFLDSVAKGYHGGEFCYQPGGDASPTMTAVGLLCRQYLGAKADDPLMTDGAKYLLAHLPEPSAHNLYYWYYATMVMHNIHDQSWDTWNRKMKRLLVETQNVDSHRCARGSWDPDGPAKDQWGSQGGRHMMTSLSTLTLEVYYRYLPLYTKNGPRDLPGTATEPRR